MLKAVIQERLELAEPCCRNVTGLNRWETLHPYSEVPVIEGFMPDPLIGHRIEIVAGPRIEEVYQEQEQREYQEAGKAKEKQTPDLGQPDPAGKFDAKLVFERRRVLRQFAVDFTNGLVG